VGEGDGYARPLQLGLSLIVTQLPFRWNLAQRQQLGSLLEGKVAEDYLGFFDDLRECCVRVLAAAADGDLVREAFGKLAFRAARLDA
jgi:hypothetical protein